MAKLPQETITTIFNLQRRLLGCIDEATATEAMIYTRRRSVEKLREVCRQYDALNLLLDEAIALPSQGKSLDLSRVFPGTTA